MKSKLGIASILFIATSLLLKISGLIRDMVIAYYFGDSYIADTYLAAFIIPNMFILFLTTGMKDAFVPSYIDAIHVNKGKHHLSQVFKGTILISFILSISGILLAPFYIEWIYPTFSDEATKIAIRVAMIFFGAILFGGMNAVLEALFDAENKFSLSMLSQVLVITSSIISAFLFAEQIGVYSLALGFLVGTILSLILKLAIVIPKRQMRFSGGFDWKEINQFYFIFIPVGITVAVGQINLMIGTIYASSFEEGAVTYINYAKNLVHMPQGIFGVTIATIIFPLLSKAISTDDNALFKKGIEKGLTTMYFVLLPSIVGMLLLMPSIISVLYERGAFTEEATIATTKVASLYFGSVLFFSLNQVINKGFYSLKKGRLIMIISGLSILLTFILNAILTRWFGYLGIPLAASVNAFLYVTISFVIFLRLVKGLDIKMLFKEYLKITIAVIIMSIAVLTVLPFIEQWGDLIKIVAVGIIGASIYILATYLLQVQSFRFLLAKMVRKTEEKKESSL